MLLKDSERKLSEKRNDESQEQVMSARISDYKAKQAQLQKLLHARDTELLNTKRKLDEAMDENSKLVRQKKSLS